MMNGLNDQFRPPNNGKFLPGNKHGRGNPHLKRLGKIRAAILEINPDAAKKIAEFLFKVMDDEKQPTALRVECALRLSDRIDGKPVSADIQATLDYLVKRLDQLEREAMNV